MTKGLKFAPVGMLLCALAVLFLKQGAGAPGWVFDWHVQLAYLPWLALLLCAGAASYVLAARCKLDCVPLALAYVLLAVGLAEIARLKPDLFEAQLRWACVGIVLWGIVILLWERVRRMLDYPYVLGIATTLVLLLPLIFGVSIGGNKNWLTFGSFSVQPSEFGKILLIFFLAAYLADHLAVLTLPARRFLFLHLPPVRFIAPLIVLWGLAVLMFVIARDLGSALLFFGMAVLMTYMGTGRKSYVFLAGGFILVAAALSYALFGHVRVRFDIWLHPWRTQTACLIRSCSRSLPSARVGSGVPALPRGIRSSFLRCIRTSSLRRLPRSSDSSVLFSSSSFTRSSSGGAVGSR